MDYETPSINVLIVEDEAIVAEDIKCSLKKFGYTVSDIASSGEDALRLINKQAPDLVLMDIKLKGKLSGTETVARFQDTHNIPVIYLTAFADEETIREVTRTYPLGYILKPIIDDRVLRTAIEVALYRHKMEMELRKAKTEAENAYRVKSEFLTNVSHELRTPLNGILGMTDFVLDSGLNENQKECLQLVHQSGHALLNIINDILEFSCIESGCKVIEEKEMNIAQEIQPAVDSLNLEAEKKNISLTTNISKKIPFVVFGDPISLRQAIFILVGNAIKFTEKGWVKVEAFPAEMSPKETTNKVNVTFKVCDSGIGIPKNKFKIIFNSFTQVDASYTREYGGTGMGLAICSRLIRLLGGELTVESTVGKGSVFSFTLPFERE